MFVGRSWRLLPLGAILLLTLTVRAESPDPRDVQATLYARQALAKNDELDALRLGVKVTNGEAIVWGVAPSWALAERALSVVGKVKGVYFVRNQIRLNSHSTEEALRSLMRGLAAGGVQRELLPLVELPPERTAVLPEPPMPRPQVVINAQPPRSRLDEPPLASGVTLLRPVEIGPDAASSSSVKLLRPLPVSARDRSALVAPAQKGLLALADKLRLENFHYRDVVIEVHDGELLLSGRVAELEHLIELARGLSRLPGVLRVDTRDVRIR